MAGENIGRLHSRINRLQARVDDLEELCTALSILLIKLDVITYDELESYRPIAREELRRVKLNAREEV